MSGPNGNGFGGDPNEDGADHLWELIARAKRQKAERLSAAKGEATERGKKPFDLRALEQLEISTIAERVQALALSHLKA